ncbi:MAG: hypothetical protein ACYDER_28120 [Ktedonobacteraceae bacterium]
MCKNKEKSSNFEGAENMQKIEQPLASAEEVIAHSEEMTWAEGAIAEVIAHAGETTMTSVSIAKYSVSQVLSEFDKVNERR